MISDPWIDRTPPAPNPRTGRQYKTSYHERKAQLVRREKLRAANKCINGPLVGNVGRSGIVHGPPVKQHKCQVCLDTYEAGKKAS